MTAEPIYYTAFTSPGRRRIRLGRWEWEIRDGFGGMKVLASGTARTEWGADRSIEKALDRCVCVTGVCRDQPADKPVLRPLGRMEAYALSDRLQRDGVPVTVQVPVDNLVVLWPALQLDAQQQAHTLNLVVEATDAPVRWAGAA